MVVDSSKIAKDDMVRSVGRGVMLLVVLAGFACFVLRASALSRTMIGPGQVPLPSVLSAACAVGTIVIGIVLGHRLAVLSPLLWSHGRTTGLLLQCLVLAFATYVGYLEQRPLFVEVGGMAAGHNSLIFLGLGMIPIGIAVYLGGANMQAVVRVLSSYRQARPARYCQACGNATTAPQQKFCTHCGGKL